MTRPKGVDTRKINLPSNRSSLIIVFTSNISLGQLKAPRSVMYLTEAIFFIQVISMPGKELQNFILLENQFLARVEVNF